MFNTKITNNKDYPNLANVNLKSQIDLTDLRNGNKITDRDS